MYPLLEIKNLSILNNQEVIRLRGSVFSKKDCGRILFLILRDGLDTLQVTAAKSKEEKSSSLSVDEYNILKKIENESFIEVIGTIYNTQQPVEACSQKGIELAIASYTILSRSVLDLPITLKEAEFMQERKREDQYFPSAQYHKRLEHRVLDLRSSLSQAIFCINDGILFYTQRYLRKHGFIEIKTPKLIGSPSEGGADLFKVNYFGQTAFLAQSPQLYKQMVVVGGFKRVFEIGPVFRAEKSDTNRHLAEFVGIDLEMVIDKTYLEVIYLLYYMLVYVFDRLRYKYDREIEIVRSFFEIPPLKFPREPVIISFTEASSLLKEYGNNREVLEDFSTEEEKQLGIIVKNKYQTDLYVVIRYPSHVRPFYTLPDPEDIRYAYAYDFMLRGIEILSGAQRIHDYTLLSAKVVEYGIDASTIYHYLESFKYGAPLHAGAGIGLERMVKTFLGLPDIRYCNLFPRDPKRLYP